MPAIRTILLFCSFYFISAIAASQITIKNPECENLTNPLAVDVMQPRLSWQLTSVERNTLQTAYEIKVSESKSFSGNITWSSGKVFSDQYRIIAGIDTYENGAGYKKILIKPHPGGGLTYANADYQTMYGTVSSHWKINDGHLTMDVNIPVNTTATIYIPSSNAEAIKEGGKYISEQKQFKLIGKEGDYFLVETGSGNYHFEN